MTTASLTLLAFERQPYDTEDSWPVFVTFRDQVPPRRALTIQVRGRNVDPVAVSRWMASHYWLERVAEYDRHLDGIRQGIRERLLAQTTADVTAEYMATLANARDIVTREMAKLAATVSASNGEVLRPRDLIHMADTILKMDRLIRGEATERVATDGDLAHLTDAQLAALDEMLTPPAPAAPRPSVH